MFDTEHARVYGLQEAVLIYNLQFWIERNRANGENFREERTWTYNSVRAFNELFPYLSPKQIRRALDSLVEKGVILTGNYNESTRDRTLWYAFADEEAFLGQVDHLPAKANGLAKTGQSHLPGKANGVARTGKSLIRADVNADGNPDGGRATRLPKDWTLKPETLEWTVAYTVKLAKELDEWAGGAWSGQHALFEAEKFRDYWTGKSGKDATKTDWPATWRNWVRNAGPMRAAKKGSGSWWLTDETALAKAIEVGVGPAYPTESRDTWHARIRAAIENGGKPPAPRPRPVTPVADGPQKVEPRAAMNPDARAALLGAAGSRRVQQGDTSAPQT
ncbi:hypothetical protein [Burkholderia gladioli]|uniref:hypothetical protein n=1 Tax=Burkholderia gladioli TaxID=28095 RepID=UPI00163EB8D7|nr:hypothetical protein [Burkholderia gladioli]